MCLISVIVPIYKTEVYLEKCIDSLLRQSYDKLQIILVDDGSPDRCPEICDRYAKMDSRIIVIHQKNAGVSSARNVGLQIAKGDFIGFVDSDDWISEDMYERLYCNMSIHNADLSICGYDQQLDLTSNLIIGEVLNINRREAYTKLLSNRGDGFKGFLCNKLFKKEIISRKALYLRQDISYMEDLQFCFRYIQCCNSICYETTPLYHYVQRNESVTGRVLYQKSFNTKYLEQLDVWDDLLNCATDITLERDIIVRRVNTCVELLSKSLENNKNDLILKELKNELNQNLLLLLKSEIITSSEKIKALICFISPKLLSWLVGFKRKYFRRNDV